MNTNDADDDDNLVDLLEEWAEENLVYEKTNDLEKKDDEDEDEAIYLLRQDKGNNVYVNQYLFEIGNWKFINDKFLPKNKPYNSTMTKREIGQQIFKKEYSPLSKHFLLLLSRLYIDTIGVENFHILQEALCKNINVSYTLFFSILTEYLRRKYPSEYNKQMNVKKIEISNLTRYHFETCLLSIHNIRLLMLLNSKINRLFMDITVDDTKLI